MYVCFRETSVVFNIYVRKLSLAVFFKTNVDVCIFSSVGLTCT